MKIVILLAFLFLTGHILEGQLTPANQLGANLNTIQTAVPFLTIAPDARAAGMGDAGVASRADMNSQHWNSAKYAFIEGRGGVSLSYTPWLRNLIPHVYLAYLSAYKRINDKNTISGSLRYFSLGTVSFSAHMGGPVISPYKPREFAIDAGYSRLFTEHFSGGIVMRYIHSDLVARQTAPNGQETKAGKSLAGDLGLFYQNDFTIGSRELRWALGTNISNIGTPVSYTDDAEASPIPANLKFGGRFEVLINDRHSISLNGDMNKLMVPTPPVYDTDTSTGAYYVVRGKEAPGSILGGMFQSFYDAPGVRKSDGYYSVIQEEMHEIAYALGIEYNFRELLVLRSGYFHEHATKGNRKLFTTGICLKNHLFALHISYLIPTNGQNSPLANTFRITFTAQIG